MSSSTIRIIGGLWRGRKIPVPELVELRPSTDRIRETLFNWLMHDIENARCLDIFSGSGILAFESLSRGAQFVTLVDKNPQVISHLQQQAQILHASALEIVQADVLQWLAKPATKPYDIIFVDPPFASELWLPVCELLTQFGWLAPNTLIYIEHPAKYPLKLPENWHPVKQQKAGNVCYGLWKVALVSDTNSVYRLKPKPLFCGWGN